MVVERYDRWMASANWTNPNGPSFRFDKKMEADAAATHTDYPSMIAIWGRNRRGEAARFADMVDFLKSNRVLADYSQTMCAGHSCSGMLRFSSSWSPNDVFVRPARSATATTHHLTFRIRLQYYSVYKNRWNACSCEPSDPLNAKN
jgi:hypothetical protein